MRKKLWQAVVILVVVATWGGISGAAVSEQQAPESQQSESSRQPSATTGTQAPGGQAGQQPGAPAGTGTQTGTQPRLQQPGVQSGEMALSPQPETQAGGQPGTQMGPQAGTGQILRIVTLTIAPDKQEQLDNIRDEANTAYNAARGLQWVKFFSDPSSGTRGSVSLWSSRSDLDAFLNSDAYKKVLEKLKPLIQGDLSSKVYQVEEPGRAQAGTAGSQTGTATGAGAATGSPQQQTQQGQPPPSEQAQPTQTQPGETTKPRDLKPGETKP